MLPILVLIATTLGIWMDKKTLQKVKDNCKKAPLISGENYTRKKRKQAKRKPSIEKIYLQTIKLI